MRRTLFILMAVLVSLNLFSQTPQAFKYQAVVRDNSGNLLTEQSVSFQIDILEGSTDGDVVYSETHSSMTSARGLVNLEIGNGTTTDDFSAIVWGGGEKYLTLWINGEEMGTVQLLSVPYALHSETAAKIIVDGQIKNVADPTDDQDVATKAYVDRQITNPGVRIHAVIDSINCFGDMNGKIDLTVEGGTPPYKYEWDDGSTSEDLEGLGAGKYQVYVEDNNGMTAFRHFTLQSAVEMQLDYTATPGAGDIDITVTGGRSPYTYLWSNGSTDEDQSGLEMGNYSVQVTDALGCTMTQEIQLGGESMLLVEWLESASSPAADYGNSGLAIMNAASVYSSMAAGKVYIIDIRKAVDWDAGHIDGSVNMDASAVRAHIDATNLSGYDEICIICYTGLQSSWLGTLLQLAGYNNVYFMKFGMSAWHEDFDKWSNSVSSDKAALFVATQTAKAAEGDLPTLNTGYGTGQDIFEARFDDVLAEGPGSAAITVSDVYANLGDYYIINYWPEAEYLDPGHIEGAIQYTPNEDLKLANFLRTLPLDKPIVVYAYTGQNSAKIAAYLRVIGYNAKSLKFGANGMIYEEMTKSKWSVSAIMGYDYVVTTK